MAPRKPPSDSLLRLCARVNALGLREHGPAWKDVEPRDVERWAQSDLVPPVERPGRGRGKGREPKYEDEHVSAIVETADVVRRHNSLPLAAAVLFMRGRAIPVDTLKRSYTEMFDRFDETINELAEKERERLDIPTDAPVSPAELAEPAAAHQLIANPATREFRADIRERGFGVQSTAEVLSAASLQAFTSGRVNEDDLTELQRRLNLPVIPEPSPEKRALPTDEQVWEYLRIPAMKQIIATATIEDFEHARTAAITTREILDSPDACERLGARGLSESLAVVQAIENEERSASSLLYPLILRVAFGIDVVAMAELITSDLR